MRVRIALLTVCLIAACCLRTLGQSYSINWYTTDGGGGTSTGGVYFVNGTVGQPDAGEGLSGGNFSMKGGFLSVLSAVQTPGSPVLNITRTETNTVVVSWPAPSTGFTLQHTTSLNSTNWVTAPETISNSGGMKYIIASPSDGNRFFRLISN